MWAVVTIPQRESMAEALIARLRQPVIKVLDLAGNCQANHIRAWREVCECSSSWVGVIQDDVMLCTDFARKVERRIAEADALGYRAISLFNSAKSQPSLRMVNERWALIDLSRLGHGGLNAALPGEQCVLVHREVAMHYADFTLRHADLYRQFPRVHDALLGLFLNSRLSGSDDLTWLNESKEANHIFIAIPNLVNHRIEVPSSIGNSDNDPRRASTTFSLEAE
jgi:GR25 family glycosyltransferase involved in LPS biosynthesis